MKFRIRPGGPFPGRQLQARALLAWRSAADLAWTRWELLREGTRERRARAFAAYFAALDARAAATATLAAIRAHRTA